VSVNILKEKDGEEERCTQGFGAEILRKKN
jgi:hypothetical protein